MLKPHNKNLNTLFIRLSLLIAASILLFPVIFTREGSFCIHQDNLHQAYPFFYKLATSLHKGYLPVWDANTYGGKNFSGEFQSGIFYPLNILWCLLFGSVNGIDVYYLDILVVLHYFICLIGMYQVGRVFKLSQAASVASALIFTFTGVLSSRSGGQTCIFFGLALLPWAIYFIGKYYLVQNKPKYLVFAGLISGLEILSGHIQPFFHSILISGIIIIFYEYINRKDWKTFFLAISINSLIITGVALLIALPQVYYGLQYMGQCYRWVGADHPIGPGEKVPLSVYAYKNILTPANIFNLFGMDYSQPEDGNMIYMGVLPLFLFIIYLIKDISRNTIREHTHLKRLLLIILVTGLLSTVGYLTFFYLFLYEIPLVNAVRELARYGVLLSFGASLMVGLAITNFPALQQSVLERAPKAKFYILLALSINALYLVLFETHQIPLKVSIPFLLGFLFFLFLLRSKKTAYLQILVVLFIFIDISMNKVNYSSTQSAFYPTTYYERNSIIDFLETTYGKYRVTFDMQNEDSLRRNIGDVFNIQTKLGYCATMNKPYFDYISADWTLNGEVNDLLNIKYVVTDKILDSNFIFKDSTRHLNLYQRKNCYPRIYWKSQLGLQGHTIEEANKTTIRQLEYSDLYQKIDIECSAPDTLVVSENYYPGWKCYDNGNKTKIFPAPIRNYPPIFRSIAVDKGHHIIEFKYNKIFYWF
jgi:hypothetical protein